MQLETNDKIIEMIKTTGGLALSAALLAIGLGACNSDSDVIEIDYGYNVDNLYSSTAITAFNIKANGTTIVNIDSLYFTIDLDGSRVFNADSLPYGTPVNKLVPNITAADNASVQISVKGSSILKDSVYSYTSEFRDSIDFTAPSEVKIIITSANEKYKQEYTVNVNVHNVKSDSLIWGEIAWATLPGNPVAQGTAEHDGRVMTLLKGADGTLSLRSSADPSNPSAATVTPLTTTAALDPSTFVSAGNALYCLAGTTLMTSADGIDWSAAATGWSTILGGYVNTVLGISDSGTFASYPDMNISPAAVPADFPVKGASPMVLYTTDWSALPTAIIVGGRKADGTLTGSAWGFDGTTWADISISPISKPAEEMTLFPYFMTRVNSKKWWNVKTTSALFALGGRKTDGEPDKTVYISPDLGLHWAKADSLLQLPDFMPAMAGAQAVVRELTLGSRALTTDAGWTFMSGTMPSWARSRAVSPVTIWECPYIYLYGGTLPDGTLSDKVWRGVINRLTFKPIQ